MDFNGTYPANTSYVASSRSSGGNSIIMDVSRLLQLQMTSSHLDSQWSWKASKVWAEWYAHMIQEIIQQYSI